MPALGLFAENGYHVTEVEFFDTEIEKANLFGDKIGKKLNIICSNMKKLPFQDESFSFSYSYNSIFHMKKKRY